MVIAFGGYRYHDRRGIHRRVGLRKCDGCSGYTVFCNLCSFGAALSSDRYVASNSDFHAHHHGGGGADAPGRTRDLPSGSAVVLAMGRCHVRIYERLLHLASRHIVAAELTIFMLLEFALGPVWVWLFVNEIPSRWTLVGGALVISAVLGRSFAEFDRLGHPAALPDRYQSGRRPNSQTGGP